MDELKIVQESEPKGGWDVWLIYSPGSADRQKCLENVSILNAYAFLSIASREGTQVSEWLESLFKFYYDVHRLGTPATCKNYT